VIPVGDAPRALRAQKHEEGDSYQIFYGRAALCRGRVGTWQPPIVSVRYGRDGARPSRPCHPALPSYVATARAPSQRAEAILSCDGEGAVATLLCETGEGRSGIGPYRFGPLGDRPLPPKNI